MLTSTLRRNVLIDTVVGACHYKGVWDVCWETRLPDQMFGWKTESSGSASWRQLWLICHTYLMIQVKRRLCYEMLANPVRQCDSTSHKTHHTNAESRRLFYMLNHYRNHKIQLASSYPYSSLFERANFRLTVIPEPLREPSSILLLRLGPCRNIISKRAEASPCDQEGPILLDCDFW